MIQSNVVRGVFAVFAATTALLAVETTARADDREQCASAADQAQQLRDEGKYRRAREQLLSCARDACPAPIKRDCLDWLAQVEATAPTIVLSAKDGTKDLSDVKVSVDGAVVSEHLDGKPIQMDLGKHTISFEYAGQTKEEEVIVGAGQKNRTVSVTFGSATAPGPSTAAPASTAETREGSIIPAVVVGGIGVVALGSFAIFGLGGKSDVDDLQACKPNCSESSVDKARSKLIIADISLGVGVVALGVATVLYLTRPRAEAEVRSAHVPVTPPKRLSNVAFDFGPVNGGAVGSFGARF